MYRFDSNKLLNWCVKKMKIVKTLMNDLLGWKKKDMALFEKPIRIMYSSFAGAQSQ